MVGPVAEGMGLAMNRLLNSLIDPSVEAGALALLGGVVAYFWREFVKHRRTNRAVLGEVRRLLIALCDHKRWYEKLSPQQRLTRPLIPFSYSIFKQQLGNIGTIDRALADEAILFYGYIDFINTLQSKRKEYTDTGEFDEAYLVSLKRATTDFFVHFDIYSCPDAAKMPEEQGESLEPVNRGERR